MKLRTLVRSRRLRPQGDVKEWPYFRAVEFAMLALKPGGYGVTWPKASSYHFLEFGVGGDSLNLMVRYRDLLRRRLRVRDRIIVAGFDTFAGLPEARGEDNGAPWQTGDFASDLRVVEERMGGYRDVTLIQGLFADTLPGFRQQLERSPPLFVSVDCDYYSSTIDIFETVLPLAPTGCLFYFDDAARYFWSDRGGELQAVREVNEGRFGDNLELCEIPLWIETGEMRHYRTLYRLLNLGRVGLTDQSPINRSLAH